MLAHGQCSYPNCRRHFPIPTARKAYAHVLQLLVTEALTIVFYSRSGNARPCLGTTSASRLGCARAPRVTIAAMHASHRGFRTGTRRLTVRPLPRNALRGFKSHGLYSGGTRLPDGTRTWLLSARSVVHRCTVTDKKTRIPSLLGERAGLNFSASTTKRGATRALTK